MMQHTTMQALAQARLADLRDQAERATLARAARQARRSGRQRSGRAGPRVRTVVTAWARRPRPAPESR